MTTEPSCTDRVKRGNRERGTLQDTLPRSPVVFILLTWMTCTAIATFFHMYSSVMPPTTSNDDISWWHQAGKASLGSACIIVSILYADPGIFPSSFGCMVLLSLLIDSMFSTWNMSLILSMLKAVSTPVIFSISISVFRFNSVFATFHDFASPHFRHIAAVATTIPLGTILVLGNSAAGGGFHVREYHVFASTMIGFVTMTLKGLHHHHRSHKHGSLTHPAYKGRQVLDTLSILCSVLYITTCIYSTPSTAVTASMPFLLGAVVTVLIATVFASVGDVWYAVGTGQFHMVATDTAGILFYVVLPVVILLLRFGDRYGNSVVQNVAKIATLSRIRNLDGNNGDAVMYTALMIFQVMIIAVGVSYLNDVCPLSGHLFGRVYTHGQPSTRRVAICVEFCDVFHESVSPKERELLWKTLRDCQGDKSKNNDEGDKAMGGDQQSPSTSGKLNVFVTTKELQRHPTIVKELVKSGHGVGLSSRCISTLTPWSQVWSWNRSVDSLSEAFDAYIDVVGIPPKWFHVGWERMCTRHPSCFRVSWGLGMRAAFWSTILPISCPNVKVFSAAQISALKSDVSKNQGGSFIYISHTHGSGNDAHGKIDSSNAVVRGICQIVQELSAVEKREFDVVLKMTFLPCTLCLVAKEDSTMEL